MKNVIKSLIFGLSLFGGMLQAAPEAQTETTVKAEKTQVELSPAARWTMAAACAFNGMVYRAQPFPYCAHFCSCWEVNENGKFIKHDRVLAEEYQKNILQQEWLKMDSELPSRLSIQHAQAHAHSDVDHPWPGHKLLMPSVYFGKHAQEIKELEAMQALVHRGSRELQKKGYVDQVGDVYDWVANKGLRIKDCSSCKEQSAAISAWVEKETKSDKPSRTYAPGLEEALCEQRVADGKPAQLSPAPRKRIEDFLDKIFNK